MDEVNVGDKVIVIEYQEDGCVFCASTIQKIYRDEDFSHIKRYDLDGFEYIERGEFITKKQALGMLDD